MTWSDAARAAALEVRRMHARQVVKLDAQWQAGGGYKHVIYKLAAQKTTYQHASGLRRARAGSYPKSVVANIVKHAAAAHVLRKYTGKGA